jgi:hypothetical protein
MKSIIHISTLCIVLTFVSGKDSTENKDHLVFSMKVLILLLILLLKSTIEYWLAITFSMVYYN